MKLELKDIEYESPPPGVEGVAGWKQFNPGKAVYGYASPGRGDWKSWAEMCVGVGKAEFYLGPANNDYPYPDKDIVVFGNHAYLRAWDDSPPLDDLESVVSGGAYEPYVRPPTETRKVRLTNQGVDVDSDGCWLIGGDPTGILASDCTGISEVFPEKPEAFYDYQSKDGWGFKASWLVPVDGKGPLSAKGKALAEKVSKALGNPETTIYYGRIGVPTVTINGERIGVPTVTINGESFYASTGRQGGQFSENASRAIDRLAAAGFEDVDRSDPIDAKIAALRAKVGAREGQRVAQWTGQQPPAAAVRLGGRYFAVNKQLGRGEVCGFTQSFLESGEVSLEDIESAELEWPTGSLGVLEAAIRAYLGLSEEATLWAPQRARAKTYENYVRIGEYLFVDPNAVSKNKGTSWAARAALEKLCESAALSPTPTSRRDLRAEIREALGVDESAEIYYGFKGDRAGSVGCGDFVFYVTGNPSGGFSSGAERKINELEAMGEIPKVEKLFDSADAGAYVEGENEVEQPTTNEEKEDMEDKTTSWGDAFAATMESVKQGAASAVPMFLVKQGSEKIIERVRLLSAGTAFESFFEGEVGGRIALMAGVVAIQTVAEKGLLGKRIADSMVFAAIAHAAYVDTFVAFGMAAMPMAGKAKESLIETVGELRSAEKQFNAFSNVVFDAGGLEDVFADLEVIDEAVASAAQEAK